MNSRLKNLLIGSVFICVGIGIGIGIGAGIWSGSDGPIDQDQGSTVDSGLRKKSEILMPVGIPRSLMKTRMIQIMLGHLLNFMMKNLEI